MSGYILRRLLMMVPLLVGITLLTFGIMHLTPGTPADLASDMNLKISTQARERLNVMYGLDKPWFVQYARWTARVARFDFGNSFRDERPAIRKIAERLPATLLLNGLSLLLILVVAIPVGVYAALHRGKPFDILTTIAVYLGFSIPAFWLALMLMTLCGLKLGWLPISGLHAINADELGSWERLLDTARHLVLPVIVSSITGLAGMTRYVRASMIDVLSHEYIRAAHAKGLSERRILFHHALRNALLPVVTIFGLSLPGLIGGGFIFETIFAFPGMGRLGFEAVMARDYPVVMAVGTIAALLTLAGNLIADITYALVDPRIRYK